jgi:hypothetical protein
MIPCGLVNGNREYFFDPEDKSSMFLREVGNFTSFHGVIYQKTFKPFFNAAAKTRNLALILYE